MKENCKETDKTYLEKSVDEIRVQVKELVLAGRMLECKDRGGNKCFVKTRMNELMFSVVTY